MSTQHTLETLKETSILGFKGILKILGYKKIFFSTWVELVSLFLSIAICAICFIFKVNYYDILVDFKTIMINFLPTIIGFTLAGYSLVVGFVQAGMLNKITEPTKKDIDNFSLYQKMSAGFGMNIILQTVALVIAFLVHFIIFIDDKNYTFTIDDELYIAIINFIGVFIISYCFFLSLFLTIQTVLNIFGFSQLHQYLINKEKINTEDK
jgi:hypothetical protein